MSADTPRDPSAAQPHHAEHGRRPEPDNGPRAEQAPPEQRAEADRSKQPEHTTLRRAEHNEARRATPPLQRPGDAERSDDGEHRGPAEAAARGAGNRADHHPGQAELRHETGTGRRDRSPTETPSRAEHNEARHARPPIEQVAAPPKRPDDGYSWPPPQADRDSARALYREDFGSKATADNAGRGRDRGINVVGESRTSPRATPATSRPRERTCWKWRTRMSHALTSSGTSSTVNSTTLPTPRKTKRQPSKICWSGRQPGIRK